MLGPGIFCARTPIVTWCTKGRPWALYPRVAPNSVYGDRAPHVGDTSTQSACRGGCHWYRAPHFHGRVPGHAVRPRGEVYECGRATAGAASVHGHVMRFIHPFERTLARRRKLVDKTPQRKIGLPDGQRESIFGPNGQLDAQSLLRRQSLCICKPAQLHPPGHGGRVQGVCGHGHTLLKKGHDSHPFRGVVPFFVEKWYDASR